MSTLDVYLAPEHEQLREQVARFIAREVEPHGEAWEAAGKVPRELLRQMGELGWLGLMFDSEYGGVQADALTNLVTGWLASDTAELVFQHCRIPAANLLGEEHKGFQAVMKNFQTERIALAAMAVGHCTLALKLTLEHVRDRQAFGATLFDKQVVRQRLAMLDAKTRAARQYLYHCAWLVTQGKDVVQDVSLLKALTGELAGEVVQACQQFHGGMGYMRGTAIERLWRDARILAIGGGATEVMLDEAAKRY
jgi:acyl-CoA dehydrogenase